MARPCPSSSIVCPHAGHAAPAAFGDATLVLAGEQTGCERTPGREAETDVLVLVSSCPQINNPCNGFDPTPVRMTVGEGGA